jgi:hypothetical protein
MSSVTVTTEQERDEVILNHMPQVRALALKAYRRCPPSVTLDDLVSAGTVGLIQAVTRVFGFRAAHVFDVTQTDGEPLPEFAAVTGDPRCYTERLKQFVAGRNIALEYDARISPARGMSSGGKITLLPELRPAEHFAVLAHEVAHELLHRGDRRQQTTHTVRETEAEAVAFVVSSAIGLDTNTSFSDYIQLHAGDKATLAESLAVIQQTASEILQSIMPERKVEANPSLNFTE